MYFWPFASKILVLEHVLLLLAYQNASLAFIDVHSFEEFCLAIHALELNVSIAARSRIVELVLIAILKNLFRLDLLLPDFFFYRIFFASRSSRLLQLGQFLVKFFLLDQKGSHSFHVVEITKISHAELYIPNEILVFINFASDWIRHIVLIRGRANVLCPSVVNSGQVFNIFNMWFLANDACKIIRCYIKPFHFVFLRNLQFFQREHRAPENECHYQVAQDDNDADEILRHLDLA